MAVLDLKSATKQMDTADYQQKALALLAKGQTRDQVLAQLSGPFMADLCRLVLAEYLAPIIDAAVQQRSGK